VTQQVSLAAVFFPCDKNFFITARKKYCTKETDPLGHEESYFFTISRNFFLTSDKLSAAGEISTFEFELTCEQHSRGWCYIDILSQTTNQVSKACKDEFKVQCVAEAYIDTLRVPKSEQLSVAHFTKKD